MASGVHMSEKVAVVQQPRIERCASSTCIEFLLFFVRLSHLLCRVLKRKVWKDTRGQDLIECALMAGFVAVAAGGDGRCEHNLQRANSALFPALVGSARAT